MTTCREFFTFSWPLRGEGGQPKRSAWPLFSQFFSMTSQNHNLCKPEPNTSLPSAVFWPIFILCVTFAFIWLMHLNNHLYNHHCYRYHHEFHFIFSGLYHLQWYKHGRHPCYTCCLQVKHRHHHHHHHGSSGWKTSHALLPACGTQFIRGKTFQTFPTF